MSTTQSQQISTLIAGNNVSPQSMRALAKYLDTRGPGESLTSTVADLLRALERGHRVTVTITSEGAHPADNLRAARATMRDMGVSFT